MFPTKCWEQCHFSHGCFSVCSGQRHAESQQETDSKLELSNRRGFHKETLHRGGDSAAPQGRKGGSSCHPWACEAARTRCVWRGPPGWKCSLGWSTRPARGNPHIREGAGEINTPPFDLLPASLLTKSNRKREVKKAQRGPRRSASRGLAALPRV